MYKLFLRKKRETAIEPKSIKDQIADELIELINDPEMFPKWKRTVFEGYLIYSFTPHKWMIVCSSYPVRVNFNECRCHIKGDRGRKLQAALKALEARIPKPPTEEEKLLQELRSA